MNDCARVAIVLATTMSTFREIVYLLCAVLLVASIEARPDSGGHVPLPGPGLSYGGIPYGSVSGNVAEYFRNGPSYGRVGNLHASDDYQRIEQYL